MKEKYQPPTCMCGEKMVFVEKEFNQNFKHNIYKITKHGYKGKVIGETDEELVIDFGYPNWLMCLTCGSKWKWQCQINDKGKITE